MSLELSKYISQIKKVNDYDTDLERQNLWWTVVAMVGKVNNQGLEPQLLDSISQTQDQFDHLKHQLVQSLVKRYLEKIEVDLKLQSKAYIDIINRNLFERTADVGFLSQDDKIVNYLQTGDFSSDKRRAIEKRLLEYENKYTVYMDIALFDTNMTKVASLSNPDCHATSTSSILLEALSSNEYIEYDKAIDLVDYKEIPLYFLQAVKSGGKTVGILCMSFKFKDELKRTFKTLNPVDNDFVIKLCANQKTLFTSSGKSSPEINDNNQLGVFQEKKIDGKEVFCIASETEGYQGYKGLDWQSYAYIPTDSALKTNDNLESEHLSEDSAQFPTDLHMLNLEINTALTIVILNGKISSLKNKVRSFLPVLDYFQGIGTSVREVFADSISHIHQISHLTMQEKALFSAKVALNVMDRNLYERANDCRWWAMNPVIVASASCDASRVNGEIGQTLANINHLYTVYTLLLALDKNGRVIGVSKPEYEYLIGQDCGSDVGIDGIKKCATSQDYTVTDFETSRLYNDKQTYIYSAAIHDVNNNDVIGGVAVVFDSEPEFKAILDDFIPKDADDNVAAGAFSIFVDDKNMVIAASDNPFNIVPGKKITDFNSAFVNLSAVEMKGEDGLGKITISNHNYIVAKRTSRGYREYKRHDNYENIVHCYVFVQS